MANAAAGPSEILETADAVAAPVLLSQEQLETHAVTLAATHALSADPRRGRPLLPRLDESAERLEDAYQYLSTIARSDPQPVASEDWLRDNYHVVLDQIREVRQDLPRNFYIELPKLADGAFEGYPRVYLIARELITHTAGRLDLDTLVEFTSAYQRAAPLSIGETWAIPIMLRLGLVEELRRLVDGVVIARRSREQARKWEEALSAARDETAYRLDQLLRAEVQANDRLSAAFVVELLQWLRDQPSSASAAWLALQRALEAQGDSPEELLRAEHQREAANQLAIGNVITSMRLLSSIDWPLFFDRVSVVEQILREDPVGAYAEMDFPTRDRYRHSIEQLSKRSNQPELTVARRAVALAREATLADPHNDRRHHVGYYLISRGRFRLEKDLHYPARARERLARFLFEHPAGGYLGLIAFMLFLGVASLVAYAQRQGASTAELWLVGLITLIPVSELAISLLHTLLTSQIPPRQLPKLAMRSGIPAHDRTIVAVPAILDSASRVDTLFDDLEVRFLANRDPHLHFALLSDFADAPEQSVETDDALLGLAHRRLDELNDRYGPDRFFLLHRERRWNPSEHCWMGWERKRGKLEELNRLLRGATDTSFVVVKGDVSILGSIRYVITLDSDTHLPMEAARRLVGTLSHPLNRPRFDAARRRVTEGYGVLQPRVQVSVESANGTTFAQVFSGYVGIDPYTTAVSDVYQDLFHEGSYVGKGIYDVDAFQAALAGRVPENRLLSHDLFEGFYARAGLCTDIELVDDYPSNYLAFSARQHRWVRGDWQIVRWLWRTVPDASGRAVPNTLTAVARWKILDNLRRSMLAPAMLALFVAGWIALPGSALVWSLLGLLVLAFPAYMQFGRSLSSRVAGVPLREHVLAERDAVVTSATQAFLSIVFLLHQSWVMADAIARTLVRLLVSRRHLLEWVTADRSARVEASAASAFGRMAGTPILALVLAVVVGILAPSRLAIALPVLVLWMLSPMLAYATGRRLSYHRPPLDRDARAAFRRVARRTWRFFDDFVGPGDHWLVPDNIQENRREFIAHRTSPTNIGLQLLSTLAARDFGYVNTTSLLNRLEPTFATMLSMQRYRGHFYNWYDTRTLGSLAPAYISTVDSGNLAGCLLTLRNGLIEIAEQTPIIDASFLEGLEDVVGLVEEELAVARAAGAGAMRSLTRELEALREQLAERPANLASWHRLLPQIRDRVSASGTFLQELDEGLADAEPRVIAAVAEAGYWLDRAATAVAERQDELARLAPWAEQLEPPGSALTPLPGVPSLAALVRWTEQALRNPLADPLRAAIDRSRLHAQELIERAERLEVLADDLVEETEFAFLFNAERQLFSIGFSVVDGRLDGSYYDTLASEARLASFIAIATGAIPPEHWFRLGRSLTPTGASRALLSWSASMFEYLMPLLVMRAYPGTLLDETYEAVVQRQIQYGTRRGLPWGASESAYYAQDLEGNYQYRAFGVPGLGLKRGLGDDLVIAPYASILATPIAPDAVFANLERLRGEGMAGRFGFYEAIDYTADRLPKDQTGGTVLLTYMAHHQGMSLLAIDNGLHESPMQNRFHADPRVQAAELLLQERIPHLVPLKNPPIEKAEHIPSTRGLTALAVRRYVTPHTLSPRTHLLSNGSYAVMLTNAGGGYSRRQNLAMTRWREDITADAWGSFIYVRDLETKEAWSTTYQPTRREPDDYEVTFAPDRATWRRVDGEIEVRTEIVVSPEDDAELRRVSLTNHSDRTRSLDVTSYAEVVLTPGDADLAHPAFSNLFVETIAVPDRDALICVRRPRTGSDRVYLVHVLSGRGRLGAATEYETDRARFVGRGRSLDRPVAIFGDASLSNTTGAVLDPIVSLRQSVRIPPGGTARLAFTTGFADNEAAARALIEKYHDRRAVARTLALASTHSQIELRHLGLTADDTMRFQRLGGRLLYGDPRLRSAEAIRTNVRGQTELWKHGISGDLPILLVRLSDPSEVPLFRELVKAHEYLRLRGFTFDLVALNEHEASYLQDLHHAILQVVESGPEQSWVDRPGGVFVRRADLMSPEDQTLLRAAARVVMDGVSGSLHEQLKRTPLPFGLEPRRIEVFPPARASLGDQGLKKAPEDREFFNGTGGFGSDGREYVITVDPGSDTVPPAPWSNVVAHAAFGFTATDLGGGFTWSGNSHDNRLTPWRNDPVTDLPGEAIFIRDRATGRYCSATPLPAGAGRPYTVRHGQGYTCYEHVYDGIESMLTLFVPRDDSVKVSRLTLRNTSDERRQLTVTLYVEWVLGENRSRTQSHVITSRDPGTGAMLARNAFRQSFGDRVAFLDLHGGHSHTMTGDRTEFLGRNGTVREPAALSREALSDRTGPALDPCGAIQVSVVLGPSESRTLVGLLGDAAGADEARDLVQRFREMRAVDDALQRVREFWDNLLGTVTVTTPDRSLDLLVNRWLPYQTLACRIWGRSAFYQSSGAFGFRDQLQDVLALLIAAPGLVRGHILHAASRQFVEGDVQHWWHEPGGQGVRTRFSDDRLWLVYATLQYLAATGDVGILDEPVAFLEGRILNPGEHEAYERPVVSPERASLYDHCVRAVALSLDTGAHGLPLMGTGDWNDGMNLVGSEGRGESVWLGWFLVSLLRPFADVAAARGEDDRASQYRTLADRLLHSLDEAWDGDWYRRAYFDDGTPLGSRENTECRIDAIAQSWAVIAGGDPERARRAMESVDTHLVRRDERIVLLLTPPFDRMKPSPGYIEGYVPGVRENGGQYTHAALWTVLAFAQLGDGDRAMELFSMLNPVTHARTPDGVLKYRAEPYVVAADVYSRPPHTGRGGWSWYTGSAGWMYRVAVESILGLTVRHRVLHIDPCIPRQWPRYEAVLTMSRGDVRIVVENPGGVNRGVKTVEVDGVVSDGSIPFRDVVGSHTVRVVLG
jgi:cyclic beta-1,2-glucan synthetase